MKEQGFNMPPYEINIYINALKENREEYVKVIEDAMKKIGTTEKYKEAMSITKFIVPTMGIETAAEQTKAEYAKAMAQKKDK